MSRVIILTSFLAAIMLTFTVVPAFGAQMEFRMLPEEQNATATIKFQRTIFLEYEEGGNLQMSLEAKKHQPYSLQHQMKLETGLTII